DASGDMALVALTKRAEAAGIEAVALSPRMGDFNEDLRTFGLDALRAALRIQIVPMDVVRFIH
ncbi:DNA primase, partial [Streptomyces galilaeus]